MRCPICKTVELKPPQKIGPPGATARECPKCLGHLLSAEASLAILGEKVFDAFFARAKDADGSVERRCPQCARFLRAQWIGGGEKGLELDACLYCKAIWFEAGEIKQGQMARAQQMAKDMVFDNPKHEFLSQYASAWYDYEVAHHVAPTALDVAFWWYRFF